MVEPIPKIIIIIIIIIIIVIIKENKKIHLDNCKIFCSSILIDKC